MVTVIIASPREKSNSKILAEKLLEELEDEKTIFKLYELNIEPCIACCRCYRYLECYKRDDVKEIFRAIQRSELLVVSSPVYFYGPPAPLKALIDRSQPYWYRKFILKEKLREIKGVVINTCASEDIKTFDAMEKIIRIWLNSLNVKIESYLRFTGLEEEGEVYRREDYLREVIIEAKRIGSLKIKGDS